MSKKLWIGFIVSAFFLYLAVRNVHPTEFWRAMQNARYLWLVPGTALTIVAFMIRSWRWRYLVEPVRRIGFGSSFSATMIGFMANNVLPARAGEVIRAVALGRRERVSKSSVLATIVMERLFDLFTILIILAVVFFIFPFPAPVLRAGFVVLVLSLVVLVALIVLHLRADSLANRVEPFFDSVCAIVIPVIIRRVLWWTPRRFRAKMLDHTPGVFTRFSHAFIDGLGILRRGRHIATVTLLSALMWLVTILGIACVLLSMSPQMPTLRSPFEAALVLLITISLAIMMPSTPGYIGVVQYACTKSLALFGVGEDASLAFSFLYQASQFVPITLVGIYYLWKENVSLADLSRGEKDAAEAPRPAETERTQA